MLVRLQVLTNVTKAKTNSVHIMEQYVFTVILNIRQSIWPDIKCGYPAKTAGYPDIGTLFPMITNLHDWKSGKHGWISRNVWISGD